METSIVKAEKTSKKTPKHEMVQRVAAIVRFLLSSVTTPEIIQYASENWGVTERQARTYIKKATTEITKETKKKMRWSLEYHIAKRERLYNAAFARGDYELCLEIEKDKAKLQGLYIEKIQLEHLGVNLNLNGSDLSQLSKDQIKNRIKKLRGEDDSE